MRFTISREKLQEGLAAVGASIPAKTTLPVLANILVETTDKPDSLIRGFNKDICQYRKRSLRWNARANSCETFLEFLPRNRKPHSLLLCPGVVQRSERLLIYSI